MPIEYPDIIKTPIKSIPKDERPRERLLRMGSEQLSNEELLAIILRVGSGKRSAKELALDLLKIGGLEYLKTASVNELMEMHGIGMAKAVQIKSALELGARLYCKSGSGPSIGSPLDAYNAYKLLEKDMAFADREKFCVILLNTRNKFIGIKPISLGTTNSSVAHPREMLRVALKSGAVAVILAHNHPSGDPQPSPEDLEVTRQLKEAGQIVGVSVLDHLIIGRNSYVSLKDKGLM